MRMILVALMLMGAAASARSGDQVVVINKNHADPAKLGLGVGPYPQPAYAGPVRFADDWREYEGEIYNVAVKRRSMEDWNFMAWMTKNHVTRLLPGWERVAGKLVKMTGENASVQVRVARNETQTVTVAHFPNPARLVVGEELTIYARFTGPGRYDYGKPLSAGEAAKRLAARASARTNGMSVASVSAGGLTTKSTESRAK